MRRGGRFSKVRLSEPETAGGSLPYGTGSRRFLLNELVGLPQRKPTVAGREMGVLDGQPQEENGAACPTGSFPPETRRGVYAAIFGRRDVRSFRPDPISDDVLARILAAAHHAPSVGFMQPWDFLLVRDRGTRRRVKQLFDGARRSKYLSMKLEGILDAPLNLCVTCDPTRGGPRVLGRGSIPETDVYSTCLAVQNL